MRMSVWETTPVVQTTLSASTLLDPTRASVNLATQDWDNNATTSMNVSATILAIATLHVPMN